MKMKRETKSIFNIIKKLLIVVFISAQFSGTAFAILQNNVVGPSSIQVDKSNASGGFLIENAQQGAAAIQGGLILYDANNNKFRSIVNRNGSLMINTDGLGTLKRILLEDDLTGVVASNGSVNNMTLNNGTLQDPTLNGIVSVNGAIFQGPHITFNGTTFSDIFNATLFNGTTFNGTVANFTTVNATNFVGNGAGLTNINASNASLLDGLDSLEFLRSNVADTYTGVELDFSAASKLDINGDLEIADTNILFDGGATIFNGSGAFTLKPSAGANVNVNVRGGGDFAVNGDSLFVETSNGFTGLGTIAPLKPLHINATGLNTNNAEILLSAKGLKNWTLGVDNGNSIGAFRIANGANLATDTKFTLLKSGNVGIGTINPATFKLEVAGAIGPVSDNTSNLGLLNKRFHVVYANTFNGSFMGDGSGLRNLPGMSPDSIDTLIDGKSNAVNVYLGNGAGLNDTGVSYSTGVGIDALNANNSGAGLRNTAVGYQTLYANTTGSQNTAMGYRSLKNNLTGDYNTAIGDRSLFSNLHGYDNTSSGFQSLYLNTNGSYNTATGFYALRSNTTGSYNTAFGYSTLFASTGNGNTALGYMAGNGNTTGKHNLFLGYNAAINLTTGSNNIMIGNGVIAASATASNQLNIGNAIYGNLNSGNIGIGYINAQSKLQVNGRVLATVFNGNVFNGGIFRGSFVGAGSGITNLNASNVNSGVLGSTYGGTGINNAGSLTYGSNNITFTTTGATSLTLPTSGTLATLAGTETLTNKTLEAPIINGRALFRNNSTAQFNGGILIKAGAGVDKVLTSDANGNATWQDVSSLPSGDAATVDGLDSTDFLRSNSSDSYTSGTLTFDAGTSVDINSINVSIADTDISLDGASTTFTQTTGSIGLVPAAGANFTSTIASGGEFKINANALVFNGTSANLGIGNVNPQATLDLNGTLAIKSSTVVDIAAVTGVTPTKSIMKIQGDGGAVNISADPQIVDGTDGQILILKGTSDINTVQLDPGAGLSLTDSLSFVLGDKDTLMLIYDADEDLWLEISRSDKF